MEHHRVPTNGVTLHCVSDGEGPAVVLLHGFPETWWSWRHQIPMLVAAGFRVIAVDLRGYGDSDKTGPYDLTTASCDIVGLLEHFGIERAHVVGHDWGGVLGWVLGALHPKRLRRLVVLNAPHPIQMRRALRTSPRQLLRSWYILAFQVPGLGEHMICRDNGARIVRMLKANCVDKSAITAEDVEPFRLAAMAPGAATAMLGWYRAALRSKLRMGPVQVPTRLIWGMQDAALDYRSLVPGTEKYVPNLDIVQMHGCGHFVHEEAPARVTPEIIGFLRE